MVHQVAALQAAKSNPESQSQPVRTAMIFRGVDETLQSLARILWGPGKNIKILPEVNKKLGGHGMTYNIL